MQKQREQEALEPALPDSRLARESIMMAANYVRVFHSKPLNKCVGCGRGTNSFLAEVATTTGIAHKPRNMFLMQNYFAVGCTAKVNCEGAND